jgi:oxygen-independent coproporphyrinogen-3 oxidase
VRAAQRAGFENITIDLIYGIPGMTSSQWERTLDEATELGVQHISAYHLTIEPGTLFGKMAKRDGKTLSAAFRPVDEAESERQFETLRRKLTGAGMEHYEISNFALPGRRAIHNSAYWSGEPYLGIGPSAHSFDGVRRREWVVRDVEKYIAGVGTREIYEGETLSDMELFNERVMTALRTSEGVDTEELERRFGPERVAGLRGRAEKFFRDGSLAKKGNRIAIPPGKFLLSDYITGELFES